MPERLALLRSTDYGTWHGPAGQQANRVQDVTSPLPPDPRATSAIRIRRIQGDYSQWINEPQRTRAQLQGPSVRNGFEVAPVGSTRFYEFSMGFEEVAAFPLDWHLVIQLHSSGSQPAAPLNLGLDGRAFTLVRHTPSGFNHQYGGRRPLLVGTPVVWNHFRMEVGIRTGPTGWVRFWDNDELVHERTNIQTSEDGTRWYPVIGWYGPAGYPGADQALFEGFRVWDTLPPFAYTSSPPPPPPPPDTTPPVVALTSPGASVSGTIPSFAVTTSEPVTAMKWTLTGPNVMQVLLTEANLPWGDFALDTTDYPDGPYTLKVEGTDAAGNVGSDTVGFEIDNVSTPPPPPPPPDNPCAVYIAERDEARRLLELAEVNLGMERAAHAATQNALDTIRARVAARTLAFTGALEQQAQQHRAGINDDLTWP